MNIVKKIIIIIIIINKLSKEFTLDLIFDIVQSNC